MPFGFGNSKKKNTKLFTTNIKDREELSEITKIAEMLSVRRRAKIVVRTDAIGIFYSQHGQIIWKK